MTKTRKHAADGPGDHAHAGVNFTVNGVTKPTDANGQACFDGLPFGSHNVTETLPSGYVPDGPLTKSVTVDNSDCDWAAPNDQGSTGANGDGSLTKNDLVPGTYSCTIVIDP